MDYYLRKKEGNELMITSRYAIIKGELKLPLHDFCVERDSKNTSYEVAGICSTQALLHIPW